MARRGPLPIAVSLALYGRLDCAALPGSPLWATRLPQKNAGRMALKWAWLRHFGPECVFCGVPMTMQGSNDPRYATIDHIDCRALGGPDVWGNAQVICRGCNLDKAVAEHAAVEWLRALTNAIQIEEVA